MPHWFASVITFSTFISSFLYGTAKSKSPNVVFFMTDDWGFNDVGYHLNTNTKTPFIDEMAQDESIIIEKYYAMPLCTQTRAAFLTGRYPMRFGLQEGIIFFESNYALTRKEILLSQEFQTQGYTTHLVGYVVSMLPMLSIVLQMCFCFRFVAVFKMFMIFCDKHKHRWLLNMM